MRKYYIAFLLLSIYTKSFCSSSVQYLGIEQGLSNNSVTAIFQDSHGFMWFGTYDGLNRYDGYKFKMFRNHLNNSASLSSNRITSICEDDGGNIWVGTYNGAEIYSNYTSLFSPLYYMPYKGKYAKKLIWTVNCFAKGKKGYFFIGSDGNGLLLHILNGTTKQVPFLTTRHTVVSDYHVRAICEDKSKRLWLFVQGEGIAYYDYKSGFVLPYHSQIKAANCLQPDLMGNIWLGNENGLYKFNIRQRKYTPYKDRSGLSSGKPIVDMCLNKSGELWIATDGNGLDILNINNNQFRYMIAGGNKNSLTSSAVYAVCQDKDSRMWIGTLRGGINIIDQRKDRFSTISRDPLSKNTLISNFILSFCEEKSGNIWIGSDGDGLSYWNRKSNIYKNYTHHPGNNSSLSNNSIVRIIEDSQGQIWLATYGGGINRFYRQSNCFIHYSCQNTESKREDACVWSLFEDSKKNLWAGTCVNGGLYKFNRSSNKFELFDNSLQNILTLKEDKEGNLWAGNYAQLIKIDPYNKRHKFYNIGNSVRDIYEDNHRNLWIAVEGKGLLKFDRKREKFLRFSDDEGLCNNSVLNILGDREGNLWLSTYYGLSKFNIRSGKFKNYYESDGLQSNQFNYNAALILRDGHFLFGGIKGFNIFYPEKIVPNIDHPKVILTGLRIDNVPFEKNNSIARGQNIFTVNKVIIPYDRAILRVDFVTPEYTAPDKIKYAYYLEGWDKHWNYSGNIGTINYSQLREGHYTLRIKSTNAEGIWNNEERVISIRVLPPWWRSWWAFSLYIMALTGCIYAFASYRKGKADAEYEIKLANLKVKQERELSERRIAFFAQIAHEFRSPLTLIINPVKEILYSKGKMIDNGELSVVYRNSKRLLSLVDQLLLFSKTESNEDTLKVVRLNLVDVSREVYLCFVQQAADKNIQYDFINDPDIPEIYADRGKIEIVLFNLITNAIKYTPEGGTISVKIGQDVDKVTVKVSDTGCGIPKYVGNDIFNRFYRVEGNNQKSGFGIGLYLVRKFVEAHKGSLTYTSQVEKGSEFKVTLLKGKANFSIADVLNKEAQSSKLFEEMIDSQDMKKSDEEPIEIKDSKLNKELFNKKPVLLITDDDDDLRGYIKKIFENDFIIYEADNGDDAYQYIKKYQPEIVLCDVVMKGMNGIELCHCVKEDPSLNNISFILLTASTSVEMKLKGIEEGADDYITKPFEKDILVARVSSLLKNRNNLQRYFYNEITLQDNNFQISTEYSEFLKKCILIIEKHLDDPDFTIKKLAEEIGMSHSSLYKKIKTISGRSVNEFIRFIKLRKGAEILINTSSNVNEAAFSAGFSDMKYFREQFHSLFGMNPSEYIKKYRKSFNKGSKIDPEVVKS
ncbi:MAG: two-component regulator propeller domain-containing protein [Bacteroidota bacterium]|nr:two-component regulator propeller domain-containing protein [Bacteroidota bacterium]